MSLLQEFHTSFRKQPVVIKYSEAKWVEVGAQFDTYYVRIEFIKNLSEYLEKRPSTKIYSVNELIRAVKTELDRIDMSEFVRYLLTRATKKQITEADIENVINQALEKRDPVKLVSLIDALINFKSRRKYKVPKEIAKKVSKSTEDLITETLSSIIPRDIYGRYEPEIDLKEKYFPTKWSADERILLYDILMREYRKRPRKFIAVVHGKKVPAFREDKVIVITPAKIREMTGLRRDTVSELLKKFDNLTQPILVRAGTLNGKPVYLKMLLVKPREKNSVSGLVIGSIDNPDIAFSFYEFTDFALKYLDESEKREFALVEPLTFTRIKQLFPSKK